MKPCRGCGRLSHDDLACPTCGTYADGTVGRSPSVSDPDYEDKMRERERLIEERWWRWKAAE